MPCLPERSADLYPNHYACGLRAVAGANGGGYLVNAMKYTPIHSRLSHSSVLTRTTGNSCPQFSTLRSENTISLFQPRIHPPQREGQSFRATDFPLQAVLSAAT